MRDEQTIILSGQPRLKRRGLRPMRIHHARIEGPSAPSINKFMSDAFTNGRCFYEEKTLGNNGCCPLNRQQVDGNQPICYVPPQRNKGLATTFAVAWQAGFHVPTAARGRVCRWVFLARVPETSQNAREQSQILDKEDQTESSPRPNRHP